MSEKLQLPDELNQYEHLDAIVASDGSRRVYGVDEHGKKRQLAGDDVARAYGYDPDNPDFDNPANDNPGERPGGAPIDESLHQEYKDAIQGEETVRVKDPETGKMVEKNVKDLNFREWVKQQEMRKAARWYTATRAHGEAPGNYEDGSWDDGIDPNEGASEDEAKRMGDRDHQERLNGQEGKDNPTKDDVDYYRWLKEQSGKGEEDQPKEPKEPKEPKKPEEEPVPPSLEDILSGDEFYQGLNKGLIAARDRYAQMTAKRRKISTVGHKRELEAARLEYEQARAMAGAYVADTLKRMGGNEELVAAYSVAGAVMELHVLEGKIVDQRLEQANGKLLKPFYDWWARQGGGERFFSKQRLLGGLKKGAVLAPLGVAGGLIAGPFLGAGLAAGAAIGVGRSLARAKIDKNSEGIEMARAQSAAHIEQAEADIMKAASEGKKNFTVEDITQGVEGTGYATQGVEGHTRSEVSRNRKRLGTAALIGVGAAVAADKVANVVGDWFDKDLHKQAGPRIPKLDERYGSINFRELTDRVRSGDFVSGSERVEAVARLKGVIGERAFNELGQEQREALLLLKNPQIDQAQEYLDHLAAGHFG